MNIAMGAQPPYHLDYLIRAMVSQPVAWLGLPREVLLVADPKCWKSKPQVLIAGYLGEAEQRLPAVVVQVIA